MPTDFTFVTYAGLPELDPDDRLAADALAQRGIQVEAAVWNDPAVDWSSSGICIVRSTWDYHLARDAFLNWAARVTALTELWNPLEMLEWNSHKRYIADLGERGAPVVETVWLEQGKPADVTAVMRQHGWSRAVVKPAVGLATRGVMRVDASENLEAAQRHVDGLLAVHDVMVQPFIDSVETDGETALVFIDGAYSHAVKKTAFQPLAPAGEAGETYAEADADEIAVAQEAMELVNGRALYGRVDLVRGAGGAPLVIELELVEPSLFMSLYPPAAERFADALIALL